MVRYAGDAHKKLTISGLTIVRNAISNGYMIAEVIDTLASVAEHQVVVCDGYSDDGTYEYLQTRNDIELYRDHWNLNSQNGLEFAKITNLGLGRCTGDYIFYLQADEIIHEDQIDTLKQLIYTNKFNAISCKFHHIRYDLEYHLTEGYKRASRVIRNGIGISSAYDGYDFCGNINPLCVSGINIYHYGYVFLENILKKMINHSENFYNKAANYANRKRLAQGFLERIAAGENLNAIDLQPILEPEYALAKHGLPLPSCMGRLRETRVSYRTAAKYTLPPLEPKVEEEKPVSTREQLAESISTWNIQNIKYTRSYRGNVWVNRDLKIACMGIAKCASTSLRNQYELKELIPMSDVPEDYFMFTIIRDPLSRFVSSYIEVVEKCKDYPKGRYDVDLELQDNQIKFLDNLMENFDDCGRMSIYINQIQHEWGFFEPHCVPQVIYLTNDENQLVPNLEIYRMDHLGELEERLGSKIIRANQSENPGLKKKLNDYITANVEVRKQLEELYKYDVKIWREYAL